MEGHPPPITSTILLQRQPHHLWGVEEGWNSWNQQNKQQLGGPGEGASCELGVLMQDFFGGLPN